MSRKDIAGALECDCATEDGFLRVGEIVDLSGANPYGVTMGKFMISHTVGESLTQFPIAAVSN